VTPPPTASDGEVRVCREMCSTCVFRPGNLMRLAPGRLRGMIEEARAGESGIVCHSTLHLREGAICRGYYDRYAMDVWTFRLAAHLGVIREVDAPSLDIPRDAV
jgi:hypothetical protein